MKVKIKGRDFIHFIKQVKTKCYTLKIQNHIKSKILIIFLFLININGYE